MNEFFAGQRLILAKMNSSLHFYIKEFQRCISLKNELTDEMAVSFLKLIFYSIYDCNTKSNRTDTETANDSYLVKIDDLLANPQKNISLQMVADELGLSTKQASRIIRQNYKTTLSDLVKKKRLSIACALLTNSDMPISAIVEYVNFPTESYFYAQFKKTYGCTPLKYRKANRSQVKHID